MKLLIYGAGGFGREVCDVARRRNARDACWDEILFIDDFVAEEGVACYGTRALPLQAALRAVPEAERAFVIALGEPAHRRSLYARLEQAHGGAAPRMASVLDTTVVLSDTAQWAPGLVVTPLCSISSQARLGANVAVNTQSIIGHDVHIGAHGVVSSQVNIGGGCQIGEGSYLGMGALVKEGLRIGSDVIIGMGSVVYNDVPDGVIALGNPARVVRANTDKRVFGNK